MSEPTQLTTPPKSDRGKVEATVSSTVHLSLTPAPLRALADQAKKLIEECPSLHRLESGYFQLETHLIVDRGMSPNVR